VAERAAKLYHRVWPGEELGSEIPNQVPKLSMEKSTAKTILQGKNIKNPTCQKQLQELESNFAKNA
jgi:hypothetical protein